MDQRLLLTSRSTTKSVIKTKYWRSFHSKVAFCTGNGLVEIFSFAQPGSTSASFYADKGVMAAAWSASGHYLAVALIYGWMELWDMSTKTTLVVCQAWYPK